MCAYFFSSEPFRVHCGFPLKIIMNKFVHSGYSPMQDSTGGANIDKKIIGGVFSDVATAEKVIHDLKNHGYKSKDISVFAHDKSKANVLEDEVNTGVTTNDEGRGKNAGKGASIGAASGGVLGGLGGLVVGLGLLTIPGIGQIAAAGPLAAALSGAAVAAGGGGIIGALVGLGMPEEQAKQYEEFLKNGKIIVLVETEKMKAACIKLFSRMTQKTVLCILTVRMLEEAGGQAAGKKDSYLFLTGGE